jgi:hypothetical protein
MTNKFQFYNYQYSKPRLGMFGILDFSIWYLFVFCNLFIGICLNQFINEINN